MESAAPTPKSRNRHPPIAKQGPGADPHARSRVSNGKQLFIDTVADGRSGWSRRFRDLNAFYVAHLGGEKSTSIAERSVIRRICTLEVELEWIERRFALSADGTSPELLDLYSRSTNTLRRLLEAIGLRYDPSRAQEVMSLGDIPDQTPSLEGCKNPDRGSCESIDESEAE
jgi:hypothetical protein